MDLHRFMDEEDPIRGTVPPSNEEGTLVSIPQTINRGAEVLTLTEGVVGAPTGVTNAIIAVTIETMVMKVTMGETPQ